MEITIHEEKINHFTFHGEKKGPITSHENTLYHPQLWTKTNGASIPLFLVGWITFRVPILSIGSQMNTITSYPVLILNFGTPNAKLWMPLPPVYLIPRVIRHLQFCRARGTRCSLVEISSFLAPHCAWWSSFCLLCYRLGRFTKVQGYLLCGSSYLWVIWETPDMHFSVLALQIDFKQARFVQTRFCSTYIGYCTKCDSFLPLAPAHYPAVNDYNEKRLPYSGGRWASAWPYSSSWRKKVCDIITLPLSS